MGEFREIIDSFMTATVHTTGAKRLLADAHRLMNEHAIRHLPVMEGGKLAGMVTQRDLHLIETLKGVNPEEVTVDEAMSADVYTVELGTPLVTVVNEMLQHKLGSAVVVDSAGKVRGIFTTIDALRALGQLLESAPPPARRATRSIRRPSVEGKDRRSPR